MSCIAGIVSLNGTAADPSALRQMLQTLRARGDQQDVAVSEAAVLGQVHLRLDDRPQEAMRPVAAANPWIAADARIDARGGDQAPHAERVARAWSETGPLFAAQLRGDFAVAVWNEHGRTLTCARDHFGVRPFYYTMSAGRFAFASDMRALLALPDLSHELDEEAVADYLLFGACMEPDRTIFRAIRCLPPATVLELQADTAQLRLRSYWRLERSAEARHASPREYGEECLHLLRQAVADRLPRGPAAFQLSGGLDSTGIAAAAAGVRGPGAPMDPAYTISAARLVPADREADYAQVAAQSLPLKLLRQELGDYALFERRGDPALATAFPLSYPFLAAHQDMLRAMRSQGASVIFSGYPADAAFAPSSTYYPGLLRRGKLVRLAREAAHHLRHTRSFAGMGLRSAFHSPRPDTCGAPSLPDWLEPAFARRTRVEQRWQQWWSLYHGATDAQRQLSLPWLSRQFEMLELWPMPLVGRYPFLDLRLLDFLLGLPNFMLRDKRVLREAMKGLLPEDIRTRPKTALPGDPARELVTNGKLNRNNLAAASLPWVDAQRFRAAFDAYVAGAGSDATWSSALVLGPIALAHWLEQQEKRSSP